MKGFSDDTLILLSDVTKYHEASGVWRRQYQQALDNLLLYLSDKETWVRCLVTDPLAVELLHGREGIEWYCTENTGGMYFLQQNAGIPDLRTIKLKQEIVDAMDKKYPIERGLNVERRGYLTSKRVDMAEKAIVRTAKCVFCFGNLFRPAPKEDDGRAVIFINNQFIPTLKLSGNDAPVALFLDVPWGNLALTEWGRYLNGK